MSELLKIIKASSFQNFRSSFQEKLHQFQLFNKSRSLLVKTKEINQLLIPTLVIAIIAGSTYMTMKVLQIPEILISKEINQTLVINDSQRLIQSKSLFGDIQLSTQDILLRGIVITSDPKNTPLDGFAIFDINGKPSNPISIGESFGNGVTLKVIRQDSVMVSYLGQDIEYALTTSKSGLQTNIRR